MTQHDAEAARVRDLRHGGEILEPPAPHRPTRILAVISDPEGNPIGLAAHSS
jgi:predicted enzyme related to lactoylglutathione lyase